MTVSGRPSAEPERAALSSRGKTSGAGTSADLWARRVTRIVTPFICWFSAHWLLLANAALVLYLGLPLFAPLLMRMRYEGLAEGIYFIFRPMCHQFPERSFFLFGDQLVYSYDQLAQRLGGFVPRRYVGAPGFGYKIAVCQRDVAIYGAMLIGSILFDRVRSRLSPLPIRWFAAMVAPLAIDGTGQLLGFWSSTWLSRVLTGGLFGLSILWLALPYLERGFREVHQTTLKTMREWSP